MRYVLKRAFTWGVVGFGVAVFFLLVSFFTHALAFLELIFWPSSLAFMALDNATTTRFDWVEGTAFLIFTNFLLYFVLGLIVTAVWRVWLRLESKIKDRTSV